MKSESPVQHRIPRDLLHDLRTPLGPILGYSELLIEQMRAAGHEEFIPFLEKICHAGRQLTTLLTENFESESLDPALKLPVGEGTDSPK
jgi:signal transduction histidine kinase